MVLPRASASGLPVHQAIIFILELSTRQDSKLPASLFLISYKCLFQGGIMRSKQLKLNLHSGKHGGRRPGSGRKRIKSKGVSHRTRERLNSRTPLHINFKFKTTIRNKDNLRLLKRAILNARSHGLRIIHFSMQWNHVHLIVEANSNAILTKGMRSLTVTFAKGLRKGKVQIERYHLHVLRSLRETRNAVMYVLFNKQKHEKGTYSVIDGYTSLMSASNALKLIKNFAISYKYTLKIERNNDFIPDAVASYLLIRCLG